MWLLVSCSVEGYGAVCSAAVATTKYYDNYDYYYYNYYLLLLTDYYCCYAVLLHCWVCALLAMFNVDAT